MRERYVDERPIWKYARYLAPKGGVQSVVVADVEESTACQILAKPGHLDIAQLDVAVPGDVKERIVPELLVRQPHSRLGPLDRQRRALPYRGEEVGKTRRVRVPVTATVVLQAGDGKARREGRCRRGACGRASCEQHNKQRRGARADSPLAPCPLPLSVHP